MHKIGIISDTHGLLQPEVVEVLQGCEAILHGGDFDTGEIMDALGQIAPVYAVRGNNDYWAEEETYLSHPQGQPYPLPQTLSIKLCGVRFFMTHNKKRIPKDTTDFDVIIYGHSHVYEEIYTGRQLLLNPGSCGPKRFTLPVTMALLEIAENGTFRVERIDLAKVNTDEPRIKAFTNSGKKGKDSPDIRRIIELVVRDTKKGLPVSKIANKHRISPELAEQICRLYLTHPGVDADGIMRKMGM